MIAYSVGEEEKVNQLVELGIQLIQCPGKNGKVDLEKLMKHLGEQGIDSILLEGGGTLNDSALQAGIVQKLMVFVAPKLFGGEKSKTPIEGAGVNEPAEAVKMSLKSVKQVGEDLLLEYEMR